ncbi:histidine kinase sensor domain protein [Orientia tsutsugamushi str. UT76]|nr:histidine kinase sensor domain protein [Orientia tsutsugamushi str. UT76]
MTNSYDLKLDLDLKNLAKQSLNFFREIEFMESIEQITLYDSMKNIIIRSKDDYVATNNVRKNIGIESLLLYLDKLLFYTYQKPNQKPTFKHGARITNCFVEFDNNTYPSRANTSPFSANVLIHCESPIILDHTVIAFLKITYNATQQWMYINNISKQVLTILLLMSLIFSLL